MLLIPTAAPLKGPDVRNRLIPPEPFFTYPFEVRRRFQIHSPREAHLIEPNYEFQVISLTTVLKSTLLLT
jgi:hypothetical protein